MVDVIGIGEQAEKFFVSSGGVDSSRCILFPGKLAQIGGGPGYGYDSYKRTELKKLVMVDMSEDFIRSWNCPFSSKT